VNVRGAPYAPRQSSFGSIRIDGVTCDYDVVIDGGEIRKRKKKPSKLNSSAMSLDMESEETGQN
jgi:hypothetical protein